MRGASATYARTPRMTESPVRRLLLAGLVVNGLVQAAGAALLGLAARSAFDGHLSRPALAGALAGAAAVLVGLRLRERSDAERVGADYAYSLGPAVDADCLAPAR